LVEITPEKHIPSKISQIFLLKKNRKFAKKKTMIGTYCLKISISEFFSGEIWGLWWLFRVHKKNKILCMSCSGFLGGQVRKTYPQK
jgi:hypothetical protein